ncbi:NACHT domain-containing protein [Phormidesmis sp. 146-12]
MPLGLEERKPPKPQGDVAPEEGSKLYREAKITQTFEHQQFLDQVLRQKQSPKSQGRRITIVGQPGAGKTTRLQQIAQWITQELKQAVIWVSLSALGGKTLEEYLLETWLKDSLKVANVSPEQKNAFVEWFKDSQTWLLLDGADEMSARTHASPLEAIASQITGWIGQARIILTCRQNLWDTHAHGVEVFDTYRTLDFSYPTQVEQFIENWFAQEEATRGQRLCVALRERGRERIQDLVKNPLLLTLLCLDWHIREGKLPETRVALYEQFTKGFYEWKKTEIPTTFQQRKQLNAKLSELALEAIEKEANRFCLRHEFISQFMGEPEDEASLFCLALKLGWLNKVGIDVSNPRESIYAFLHPTFEEYFAALEAKERLTFEQLRDEVFGRHWQNKAWREVLLLICGIIDAESAGKLIEFLMEQELEHHDRDFGCLELYEDYERYCANHALKKLLIAADCFGEVEQPEVIELISSQLLSELKEFYEDSSRVRLVAEFATNKLDDFSLNLMNTSDAICDRIAKYFQNEPNTLSWLKEQFKAIRYPDWSDGLPLIRTVTHYFHDDVQTLTWLVHDVYPSADEVLSPFVLDEIGRSFRDNPQALVLLQTLVERGASDAVFAIAKYYVDEPTTLSLLTDYAQQDRHWSVQASALVAIVRHYGYDLETLAWVQQFILECECSVQEEVVEEIVEHYSDSPNILVWLQQRFFPQAQESRWRILNSFLINHPKHPHTFELLQDCAANAADLDTRQWATGELEQWEKEKLASSV